MPALARAYGDRPAVVVEGDDAGAVLTYRALDERSARLARGLLARGIDKGSHVGLLLENGPDWVVAWAAVSRIGAVVVPLSTVAKPPELRHLVRHADLRALIGQPSRRGRDTAADLEAALPGLQAVGAGDARHDDAALTLVDAPYLRWIAFTDGPVPAWARPLDWVEAAPTNERDALNRFDQRLLEEVEGAVGPGDLALIVYTSGQSADPKGVMHTHGAIMRKIHYLRRMFAFDASTRSEASAPFFWAGGLVMSLLPTLETGGTVVCRERPENPAGRAIGTAADRPNPNPHLPVIPALGMTETFGVYSWAREWRVPGHPLCPPLDEFDPDVEIKVVDASGAAVGDGGRGEIRLRGPTVTAGFYKVPRHEVFDDDGFLRTGDEVEVDNDRLHFVGRLSDVIKTSGANVSPAEVERAILEVGSVHAAYVVGIDDAARGQVVAAAVVPEDGQPVDVDALRAALHERLSSYKVPKRIAVFDLDEIPLTPSVKVRRRVLADMITARTTG